MTKLIPSLEDALAVAGLATLGYGLHLYRPWVAFSVVGALLLAASVALGRVKGGSH